MKKIVSVLLLSVLGLHGAIIADLSSGVYTTSISGSLRDARYIVEEVASGPGTSYQAIYQVRADPGGGGICPPSLGCWMTNTAFSAWVGPILITQRTGQKLNPGDYLYTTTFEATGYDLNRLSISGVWAADGYGTDILINGKSTGKITDPKFDDGAVKGSYTGWTGLLITNNSCSGGCFEPGTNLVTFRILNNADETGFRVQASVNIAEIPEPSTLLLGGAGLALLLLRRRGNA